MMSLYDLDTYADRKVHPNKVFGQQKFVLEKFLMDQDNEQPVFDKILPLVPEILPLVPEILRLGDEIQKELSPFIGRWKVDNKEKGNRAGSPGKKNRPAHFGGGQIPNFVPMGLLLPALAAFRANVDRDAWEGKDAAS